jgi:hypothetical protein
MSFRAPLRLDSRGCCRAAQDVDAGLQQFATDDALASDNVLTPPRRSIAGLNQVNQVASLLMTDLGESLHVLLGPALAGEQGVLMRNFAEQAENDRARDVR